MDIAPGTKIRVEITASPRSEAARKTLNRVCGKDPAAMREIRRRKQHRPSLNKSRRGGRLWEHRMKSRPPVQLTPGAAYTLQATVDVIRDLQSVSRWVAVTSA
jgi:hypothetical protein